MAGIGLIVNPLSGSNLRDPRAADRLARVLGPHGVVREARVIEDLYRVAAEFRKLEIDVLAISGGDGTSGVTITGFLDVYAGSPLPQFALLRGGTINAIAASIGLRRGGPDSLLGRLVNDYRARRSALPDVERHVLGIRTRDARPSVSVHPSMPALAMKYGFLFGTGVVYGFLAEYYSASSRTPAVAGKTLLRAAASTLVRGPMIRRMARPFRGSVELADGSLWEERDYLSIAGGTVAQIGLGFSPFHRATERPGTFHLLGIHASPFGFLRQLSRIRKGQPMRPGHAYEALVERVTVRSSAYPLKYMLDGDLYESEGPLDVSIGPTVRLIVPDITAKHAASAAKKPQ